MSDGLLFVVRGFPPRENVDHLQPGWKLALSPGEVAAEGSKACDDVRGVLAGIMAKEAALVHGVVPDVDVLGSIVLNNAVGGLNPLAVEIAAREGARIVWLPTVDTANEARKHQLRRGISTGAPACGESIMNLQELGEFARGALRTGADQAMRYGLREQVRAELEN